MTIEPSGALEGGEVVDDPRRYNVLVAGGGNAAPCAAIAARRAGASVMRPPIRANRFNTGSRPIAPYHSCTGFPPSRG
jgi:alkyl hydroperoxide reductase subunit AhpF